MAGTVVRCRCGRDVVVPCLGELRKQAEDGVQTEAASQGGFRFRLMIGVIVFLAAAMVLMVVIIMRQPVSQEPPASADESAPPAVSGPRFRLPEKLAQELANMAKDPAANLASQVDSLKASIGSPSATVQPPATTIRESPGPVLDPAATFGEFCSTCHVLPTPDVEPRETLAGQNPPDVWVCSGTAARAGRQNTAHRGRDQVLVVPRAAGPDPATGGDRITRFEPALRRRNITLDVLPSPSAISCVRFVQLSDDAPVQLLISDMSHGLVALWTPSDAAEPVRVVARIPHPSRTHVVDLDGDGLRDILVADLGSFWPVDTSEGAVVWLRNRGQNQYDPKVLIDGLGRVNDVAAADFDVDGDLDLAVGIFGNLTTGMILYLENVTQDYASPELEPIPLERRTGASDVCVLDLNHDERPDFVSLQSQESETVLGFMNRGWGSFRSETIHKAPHPRWGSTGIVPFDLDGDEDLDLLYNHGDAVEFPPVPRPYHGVSWLENRGGFPFEYHRLTHLPGAHTSLPADLDGDGDADVVSSVFIPLCDPNWEGTEKMDTVVWLEQTAPGQFRRHSLERRMPIHPCGDVGDYDGDGDVDIILGNFFVLLFDKVPSEACLTVLENQRITAGAASLHK